MVIKKLLTLISWGFFFATTLPCFATLVKVNGKLSEGKFAPIYSLDKHFELGCELMEKEKWDEALINFLVISTHFPEDQNYSSALFFSGVCYYFLKDYQLCDRQMTSYLNQKNEHPYFEKVFLYKYHVAEAFRLGATKHLFDFERFPKLFKAYDDALRIYDEVISSLPHQELGAKALFGKAQLLRLQKNYKESIDALTLLIKRFPKNAETPDSYLLISDIYVEESLNDAQNPDLLALAKVNLNHFKKDFPGDERVALVESHISSMEEIFASSLYDTGRFYERKKKPKASLIYYEEAIKKYPHTASAEKCKQRLENLPQSNA